MTRLDDWHARLAAYVYEAGRTPFAYGAHDCALFAAGAVAAMTGTDLASDWRGRYRTLAGGLKAVKRAGHADHVAQVMEAMLLQSTPQIRRARKRTRPPCERQVPLTKGL